MANTANMTQEEIDKAKEKLKKTLEPLKAEQFKKDKVTFIIKPLVGEVNFLVWEILRPTVFDKLAGFTGSDKQFIRAMLGLIGRIPREDMVQLRSIFFENISFKIDGNTNTPQGIVNGGEMWRQGMSPMLDYELIARSMVVNFLDSSQKWFQSTGLQEQLAEIMSKRSTSTPSWQHPLKQG